MCNDYLYQMAAQQQAALQNYPANLGINVLGNLLAPLSAYAYGLQNSQEAKGLGMTGNERKLLKAKEYLKEAAVRHPEWKVRK